jgi:hypothetical protein
MEYECPSHWLYSQRCIDVFYSSSFESDLDLDFLINHELASINNKLEKLESDLATIYTNFFWRKEHSKAKRRQTSITRTRSTLLRQTYACGQIFSHGLEDPFDLSID